jgi:hypothetical protein
MSSVCPHCGKPMIPRSARFPHVTGRVRSRVVDLIAENPGIGSVALMGKLYAEDEAGGPLSRNIISVFVYHARMQIKLDGHVIETSTGPGGGYRIRKIYPGA